MIEVLTLLPTNSSNTYPYAAKRSRSISAVEAGHNPIADLQNKHDSSIYKPVHEAALFKDKQSLHLKANLYAPAPISPSSSTSSLATVIGQDNIDSEMAAAPPPPRFEPSLAHDRGLAAGSPMQSQPSASAPPQANGKAKTQEYTTQFVHLPNVAPRSYTILKEVGDGSFGTVWLADWHSPLELPPGTAPPGPSSRPEYKGKKLVAIKRMKKAFEGGWDECMQLKELKSLRTIPMHPYIIPLYDAFLLPSTKELYFVFECMEGNLYQLTKSRRGRPLANGLIVSITYQMLLGLHHVHSSGFFHRDMKPENLLITTTGLADYPASSLFASPDAPPEKDVMCVVKLADFGLAREIESKPPYTEYVSTRWYRAPEVLLRSRDYSGPVDMWALGTILAEMVNLKPLFPGQSEVDQVIKICDVLGDPATDFGVDSRGRQRGGGLWEKGVKMGKAVHFNWPKVPPVQFASLFDPTMTPPQLIDCIMGLLRYDPRLRFTTTQCITHDYFSEVAPRFAPMRAPGQPCDDSECPYPPVIRSSYTSPDQSPYASPSMAQEVMYRQMRSQDRHVSLANSFQSMPESIRSEMGDNAQMWDHRQNQGNRMSAMTRGTTGASSIEYFDGSIFEGVAPTRDGSLRSFSLGPDPARTQVPPAFHGDQTRRTVYDDDLSMQLNQKQKPAFTQPLPQQPQSGPTPSKSSRWLSSVFASSDSSKAPSHHQASNSVPAPPTQQAIHHSTSSISLKRSPSQRSNHQPGVDSSPPAFSSDPKKAKKEAEKAAKEAEKAKREAATQAARERARAVMQKRQQLNSQADYWGAHPNQQIRAKEAAALQRGKQRATGSGSPAHLPKITESAQLRPPDSRMKSRRRDDDDDVHSISSTETRGSSERRYSFASYNTMDSDPGPSRPNWATQGNSRTATASSYGSFGSMHSNNRRPGLLGQVHDMQPPGSSSSSVDGQLARNFQGLSAADAHWSTNSYSPPPPENDQQFKLFTSASFQHPGAQGNNAYANNGYYNTQQRQENSPYPSHPQANNFGATSYSSLPADLSDKRPGLTLPFLPQMLSNVPPQDAGSPALYKLTSPPNSALSVRDPSG